MRLKCILLQTVAVCLCGISPAFADGGVLTDIGKGAIDATGAVVGATGKVIGHLTFGTPHRDKVGVVAVAPPQETLVMSTALTDSLCARRAALEQALANAEAERIASNEQVEAMRAQLNSVMAANAAERLRESLTFDQAVAMAQKLDDVSSQVTEVTEKRFSPLVIVDPETHARRIAATETVIQHFE